jgi:hypothetical protein
VVQRESALEERLMGMPGEGERQVVRHGFAGSALRESASENRAPERGDHLHITQCGDV